MTIALAASLIEQGGLAEDGRAAAEQALESGAAAERFAAMIAALGGPSDLIEAPDRHLAAAPVVRAADARARGRRHAAWTAAPSASWSPAWAATAAARTTSSTRPSG